MDSIRAKLASGAVIVVDGGVGTEIQRRGAELHPSAWSGYAQLEAPDIVREVHAAYVEAGADVITANTFSSAKHILFNLTEPVEWKSANRTAIRLAREAAEASPDRVVWVAGSISTIPLMGKPRDIPRGRRVRDGFRQQAEILAEAGADLLIAEMMIDPEGTDMVVDACARTGLPVWAGFSARLDDEDGTAIAFRAPGKYRDLPKLAFRDLIRQSPLDKIDAAGVMHTKLPAMEPALAALRQEWSGPLMAYAEIGHIEKHLWRFEDADSPQAYARAARGWIDRFGVRVVGGCCGSGPEHIRAVREAAVSGQGPGGAAYWTG